MKADAVSYKKNKKKIDDIVTELVGDPGHCVKWCYVEGRLECCDKGQESFLMAIPATGSTVTILDAENRALPYQVLPVTEGFKDFKIIDSTQHKKAKKIVLVLHGKRKNITLDIPV